MKWSEKKNPFKAGDRVIVERINGYINTAVVKKSGDCYLHVVYNDNSVDVVSWRQCKKLVKKKKTYPKELWVNVYHNGNVWASEHRSEAHIMEGKNLIGCIRYVPAKDQKK